MKPLFLIFALMFTVGCTPVFVDYTANVGEAELPHVCNGLISLLEKEWKTRKGRNCHYYNGIEVKIVNKYKDCLVGMNKNLTLRIFGNPDISKNETHYYNFHKKCPKVLSSAKQMKLLFENNKVVNIEWSGFMSGY